jgi:hypothetical protein
MQTIDEFQSFFESELKLLLQPLEDYRIKRIKKYYRIQYFAMAMGLLLVLSSLYGNANLIVLNILFILTAEGFAFESLSVTNSYLKKDYKNKILPQILNFINSDYEYIPNQKISKTVFEKSLLFPHEINIVKGEDFMRFSIEDTDIMFCESEVYGYNLNSKMFDGIFISATFNKSFTSKTFIFPEKTTSFFRKIKFKLLGSSYIVKLEDPEFEREFIILSEDQVESRYILSTSLMQRILEYKNKLKAELAFSFISKRMYCTIPSPKNLFEPAIFESFFDYDFILKSYEPILLYTGIVKDLNLNLRIWSKP